MFFYCNLEYRGADGNDQSCLTFESENELSAIKDIFRFIESRQQCLPEIFGTSMKDVFLIKLSKFNAYQIDENGILHGGQSFSYFEIKDGGFLRKGEKFITHEMMEKYNLM